MRGLGVFWGGKIGIRRSNRNKKGNRKGIVEKGREGGKEEERNREERAKRW